MQNTFIYTIQLFLLPALSPLFIGLTRKIKAKFQGRRGASVFQPYRDLFKLFHKDEVISSDASFVFRFAPYIVFASTVLAGAFIPVLFSVLPHHFAGDFLAVIYILALGAFFMALAGLDVGGAFGGFGGSREMMLSALFEGGMVFSLLTLAIIHNTTDLFLIANASSSVIFTNSVPVILAFAGFFLSMLAETCRYPYDNPATHLELTMIHEAMILEYSGKRLALMEWASANKYLLFIALGANLFFPWGIAHSFGVLSVFSAFGFFLFKASIFSLAVALIESSIAKFRIFRLPDLLFASFIMSVIAIGLIV